MLYFEFLLRKFQNLNFHFNNFMKQYFPNSDIIITTYPFIYLYIELLVLAIHCSNLPKQFGFGTIGVGLFLVFEVVKLFYHHWYWYSKDSNL